MFMIARCCAAELWGPEDRLGGCRKRLILPQFAPNETFIIRKVANGSTTITGAVEAMGEGTILTN
jgi:hypothetical protein